MERSERRDDTASRPEIAQETSPPGSGFCYERLHPGEPRLSVCPHGVARKPILRLLEMSGSFPLSDEAIDEVLTQTSPGNYALGYMDGDAFQVFYVGRSDSDVRQRLHEWVGRPSSSKSYAPAAMAPWGVHHRGPLPVDAPALARVASAESSYTRFAYSYASSAETAFEKECRNYDDLGGSRQLDNEASPSREAA